MSKKAFVTGATGQDASYLIELLLTKNYIVHGLVRRSSAVNTERIEHLWDNPNFIRHYGDVTDGMSLVDLIYNIQPDEIYNLAAMSHVRLSFDMPVYTGDATALGTTRLLEAVRKSGIKTKIYQASSSELFGTHQPPQSEETPFHPASPYGVAKLYAHWIAKNYRDAYGMFVTCGILFNHESPRRGVTFVSRKIAKGVAAIKAGKQDSLELGNLSSYRDWGYAPEYVKAMWLMMQQDKPMDLVIGTGESHSVEEFASKAFIMEGLNFTDYVTFSDKYTRPVEVDHLRANAEKAYEILGWNPAVTFPQLIYLMVQSECTGKEVKRYEF